MKVLVIGGTGLISTGIIKHLLVRKADVTMLNRGQRENRLPQDVQQLTANRDDPAVLERTAEETRYDVVIDMMTTSAS